MGIKEILTSAADAQVFSIPRHARFVVPRSPRHGIRHGRNRRTLFAGDDDYLFCLKALQEWNPVWLYNQRVLADDQSCASDR